MIERFIDDDLTLKRWRRFKSRRTAVWSGVALLAALFLTLIAPILANSKPLYMSYNGSSYFPVFVDYHPRDFGIKDSLVVNYRKLSNEEGASSVWPIIKWDPFESNKEVDSYPSGPSSSNWLGTDDRGRDVMARLLYGFKYSISYAFFVWLLTFFLGTIIGGVMGYAGGKVDFIGQRFVEVLSTVPQFFLLIILISIFTPNLWWLVAISSIFGWIPISYYVRGEFLQNRKKDFVEGARALGATHFSLIFKHILPNSLTSVITFAPFTISANIVGLASLDYLGFGLEIPTPSWGELLAQAQKHISDGWWLAVFPSLALFFTLTFMNLLGEGVIDAMDPNMSN